MALTRRSFIGGICATALVGSLKGCKGPYMDEEIRGRIIEVSRGYEAEVKRRYGALSKNPDDIDLRHDERQRRFREGYFCYDTTSLEGAIAVERGKFFEEARKKKVILMGEIHERWKVNGMVEWFFDDFDWNGAAFAPEGFELGQERFIPRTGDLTGAIKAYMGHRGLGDLRNCHVSWQALKQVSYLLRKSNAKIVPYDSGFFWKDGWRFLDKHVNSGMQVEAEYVGLRDEVFYERIMDALRCGSRVVALHGEAHTFRQNPLVRKLREKGEEPLILRFLESADRRVKGMLGNRDDLKRGFVKMDDNLYFYLID